MAYRFQDCSTILFQEVVYELISLLDCFGSCILDKLICKLLLLETLSNHIILIKLGRWYHLEIRFLSLESNIQDRIRLISEILSFELMLVCYIEPLYSKLKYASSLLNLIWNFCCVAAVSNQCLHHPLMMKLSSRNILWFNWEHQNIQAMETKKLSHQICSKYFRIFSMHTV